jgi:hypothetical protein
LDIIKSLNDLLGGQLLLWKVVLTSLVFAGAGLQVLLAARFYEASTVPPVSTGAAATAHRVDRGSGNGPPGRPGQRQRPTGSTAP